MNGRVQRIELPGGAVVHARLTAPGGGYGDDDEDVGFADTASAKVEQLQQLITDVGGSVLRAAAAAGPDEASVTFGVELTAKSGAALAVLASGEAKTSIQVTLVWRLKDRSGQAGEAARIPAGPGPGPVPPVPPPPVSVPPAAVPQAPVPPVPAPSGAVPPNPAAAGSAPVAVPPPPAHPPAPVRPPAATPAPPVAAAPDPETPAAPRRGAAAERGTGGDGAGGSGTAPA
ncbi:CU044_2847 family protein [Streptomyces qinzhouensis]|uniref:CU044_2847 family protein n=1 Tax=Streptomyces qinzhouensis TaxID=2599401 RepID=UPI001C93A7C9|nr:CU044_2847 family protein [Streptomyces qinzhouensis]